MTQTQRTSSIPSIDEYILTWIEVFLKYSIILFINTLNKFPKFDYAFTSGSKTLQFQEGTGFQWRKDMCLSVLRIQLPFFSPIV